MLDASKNSQDGTLLKLAHRRIRGSVLGPRTSRGPRAEQLCWGAVPARNERFSAKRSSSDSTQRNTLGSMQLLLSGYLAPIGAHCGRDARAPRALRAFLLTTVYWLLATSPLPRHERPVKLGPFDRRVNYCPVIHVGPKPPREGRAGLTLDRVFKGQGFVMTHRRALLICAGFPL
jgi:hypothetical protein